MGFEAFLNHFFGFLEPAAPHQSHDCFKLYFPFTLAHILYIFHDWYGSVIFTNHLKVFRVLQKSYTLLLLRCLNATTLNTQTSFIHISLVLHDTRSYKPEFPFAVVWAFKNWAIQIIIGLLILTNSFIYLSHFYVDFPMELSGAIAQHIWYQVIKFSKLFGANYMRSFLVELKILEP